MTTKRPASKLQRMQSADDGIGLVEVIIALMIFSVIAIGMGYSLAAMQRLTAESTSRQVAANLAAGEIDWVQAQPDAFDVYSKTYDTPAIDGVVYTIKRSIAWVSTSGATGACGTGGGNLQYKKVNVEVSWPGMYLTTPVRADSALAPDSRINDPSYGTILVAVTGEDGKGRSGVTVRVTPLADGSGAQTITDTIDPTDADGCSYILKVAPGNYKVEVEKAGYIDKTDAQSTVPFYPSVQVVAGATATAGFTYDNSSTFAVKWAANSTDNPALPSNLDTSFLGGLKAVLKNTPTSPVKLYPMPAGYQAVAGDSATCLNVDPGLWTANTTKNAGVRADPVATPPGGTGQLNVPMGVISVTLTGDAQYITAVRQTMTATSGNPGCAAANKTYTFSTMFPKLSTQKIALPYGKWIIYSGTAVGGTTITPGTITVLSGVVTPDPATPGGLVTGLNGGGSTVSGQTVTLDPRVLK